ncbi:TIGR03986 family type III CRISPR-associated RAMP protein [Allochromatium vinosum]|uniref:TIGR03986 family type III CRISPR-associated RAMP protein n=1 Tax=Allochromatium vinosum TaxID=1049 RepID=UPI001902FB8A|nr:TIGR03986 family CRISPR-associated RAMP protein [Allochromatium vinosum]MBK1654887.1 TIGR03986 family CRISPR-associated RAMP protein [Allochromatium vinosum]
MAPPVSIDAPYNFVPLADWVHCPDWADQVSHDLPFKDGLSGHLDLKITTHTPLLVGGVQQNATTQAPGEVRPFRMPDGRYAIPGTSLKGMIRAVVEIASFSRMSLVDDVRYGLRDISGPYVKSAYLDRVRSNVKTGFMQLGSNGLPVITPCDMVRLSHRQVEAWLGLDSPPFAPSRSVKKKYEEWSNLYQKESIGQRRIRFTPSNGEAINLGTGSETGVPVLTGQISASDKKNGKSRDFVFYNENPQRAFELSLAEWADFLYVHGDQATKDAADMSWPGYWKDRYWRDQAVPVFYLQDKGKTRVGLAYMPRLSGDYSTHQMIGHTKEDHLQGQGRGPLDFAETLFGNVGDNSAACLKGRVSFGHAVSDNATLDQPTRPTILNGPKASYFPNYVRQKTTPSKWTLKSKGYATCIHTSEHPRPEIRGWKRYPARPGFKVQELTNEQKNSDKKSTQVILHLLKEKAVFSGRVTFHNLKPEELGALCWALEWAGNERLRHGLGMAKSFGFGQVEINISGHSITPNDPCSETGSPEHYRQRFMVHMLQVSHWNKKNWSETSQIRTLLGMADPSNAEKFPGKLEHMRLETKKRDGNEFVIAKKSGLVLAEYPTSEIPSIESIEWEPIDPPAPTPTPYDEVKSATQLVEWSGVEIHLTNPGSGELTVKYEGKTAIVRNPDTEKVRNPLPDEIKDRLKNKKLLKNCRVHVEPKETVWKLTAILAVGETLIAT